MQGNKIQFDLTVLKDVVKLLKEVKKKRHYLKSDFKKKTIQAKERHSYSFHAFCDKLLHRGQSKGQKGEQNRAENEQIQRQRKESKGTSEVRRQSHCVNATIKAAPIVSTRPVSENTAITTSCIKMTQIYRSPAGGLPRRYQSVIFCKNA